MRGLTEHRHGVLITPFQKSRAGMRRGSVVQPGGRDCDEGSQLWTTGLLTAWSGQNSPRW